MHEQSIANSLIDGVVEQLITSGGTRVRRVTVEVGELSGIVPAALLSAFKIASDAEPAVRGATLEIRPVAVTVYCDDCKSEQSAVSPQLMQCTVCGRSSARVMRGRELELVSIEVDDVVAAT